MAEYLIKAISIKRSGKWETSNMPKKLVIRNFAEPELEAKEKYNLTSWKQLESAIFSILNPKSTTFDEIASLEELYQAVQNICSRNDKHDAETYKKLKEIVENYIRGTLLKQFVEPTNQRFLTLMEQCWSCFCVQLRMIRNIFLYLDRTYVLRCFKITSIWDMGLDLFREIVVMDARVHPKLINCLLELFEKDRQSINRPDRMNDILSIRNTIRMLLDLSVYPLFEVEYLKESQQFYSTESVQNIRNVSVLSCETIITFLKFIDSKFNEESNRMAAIQMDSHSTTKKLVQLMEKELIESNLDVLLTKTHVDGIFSNPENFKWAKLFYSLLNRIPDGTGKLCVCFNQFIKTQGKLSIHLACQDVEKEKVLIQEIIDFKDKLDRLVRDSFDANERFVNSLKEAFENFINVRTNKVAELIAKYIDSKLRQASFDSEEISFDQLLDRIMVLFRFIHGKDIFEAFFQRDLAKRLLGGKSASVDAEKLMLLKLKQECGGAFTSKLEAMFKDVELSRELTASFKIHLAKEEKSDSPVDMSVSVLTCGIWPTYQPIDLLVPEDLLYYEQIFASFYHSKHQGRKLQWQHGFGHCLLKANFNEGVKELQVSFVQALVLLQFNNADELSLSDIRTAIMPKDVKPPSEKELRRTMQSLACGKVRVLNKNPKGREILDEDRFVYCSDFQHKLFRIKINQVQWKETYEENVATQERVSQDRQYQLDAALVRIMKMRKTLTHTQLVAETYDKINFPASSVELKKRIESLIERDYMRRDKSNESMYHYVA